MVPTKDHLLAGSSPGSAAWLDVAEKRAHTGRARRTFSAVFDTKVARCQKQIWPLQGYLSDRPFGGLQAFQPRRPLIVNAIRALQSKRF